MKDSDWDGDNPKPYVGPGYVTPKLAKKAKIALNHLKVVRDAKLQIENLEKSMVKSKKALEKMC